MFSADPLHGTSPHRSQVPLPVPLPVPPSVADSEECLPDDVLPAQGGKPDVTDHRETLVIGGGPAGLTAARELALLGRGAAVLEASDTVGGISQTASYNGYRFDLGGHRFFTKSPVVQRIWEDILGDELLERSRMSRILYKGKFFDYPLKPVNALRSLGIFESMRCGLSYVKAKALPKKHERTFEDWVVNRFGRRLFEIFFKTYTEKVWGIPCSEIGADWASQRIKNLDLWQAVKNAITSRNSADGEVITTLIDRFQYPRLGPGMLWEACRDQIGEQGVPTFMNTPAVAIQHDGERVTGVTVMDEGEARTTTADEYISSMPLRTLVRQLEPAAPAHVLEAADRLKYRDFLTVILIVDQDDLFPDNWVYVHERGVRLGRVQNFKNWSPEMVPVKGQTTLGLEYFVNMGDDLWEMPDDELGRLGTLEMDRLGLVQPKDVIDTHVVRVPKAYPVYDRHYKDSLATVREYLDKLTNLQSIGRNGQHRYNNQDHSMLTGVFAARNLVGENHDIWSVNVDGDYHESDAKPQGAADRASSSGDRLIPIPLT